MGMLLPLDKLDEAGAGSHGQLLVCWRLDWGHSRRVKRCANTRVAEAMWLGADEGDYCTIDTEVQTKGRCGNDPQAY